MSTRFAVITFPGSNGEHDALKAVELGLRQPVEPVWYKETSLDRFDALLLPGGFSYGDYLRPGAIAQFAPIMAAVREFSEAGGPVLGICNGFQVLTESQLLPGALLRNQSLQFRCRWSHVRIENSNTVWTRNLNEGDVLRLPIAHGDGRYFAEPSLLQELEANNQIVMRYCSPTGERDSNANPNGSVDDIAGISNAAGNIVGMMPHPERAYDDLIGGDEGLRILEAVVGAGAEELGVR
jgi:phosphoribosylformylglycinamidine synthase subunit PurQ / glutaminase